ncbi:hypothetical protein HKX68_19795 [Dickeya dadantii]|uniref:hypothetical protein n=1 Tax=Dickeya dadantii TaxID=204038 RepID=UPI001372C72B|nr:hypothetical protein [Dickeya dadantii]NAT78825.1 hypothetical protein [Dickeya dadantii]NPE64991.1 hypothetical protein [Dickeya dadantii]
MSPFIPVFPRFSLSTPAVKFAAALFTGIAQMIFSSYLPIIGNKYQQNYFAFFIPIYKKG